MQVHLGYKDDQSPALKQKLTQYRRQLARRQQLCGKQHEVGLPVIKAQFPVTNKKEGKKKKIPHSPLLLIFHFPLH